MTKRHHKNFLSRVTRAGTTGTVVALAVCMVVSTAFAQSAPVIYPSQGQSMEQQSQDEAQCRGWAQQQTGFNPSQGPSYQSSGGQQSGQVVGGAARGAALGAIGGAIGGDAGKGAAIGAGIGAVGGLLRRSRQQEQQQQAQAQAVNQYNQQVGNFNRFFGTCMQGRGYAVN